MNSPASPPARAAPAAAKQRRSEAAGKRGAADSLWLCYLQASKLLLPELLQALGEGRLPHVHLDDLDAFEHLRDEVRPAVRVADHLSLGKGQPPRHRCLQWHLGTWQGIGEKTQPSGSGTLLRSSGLCVLTMDMTRIEPKTAAMPSWEHM